LSLISFALIFLVVTTKAFFSEASQKPTASARQGFFKTQQIENTGFNLYFKGLVKKQMLRFNSAELSRNSNQPPKNSSKNLRGLTSLIFYIYSPARGFFCLQREKESNFYSVKIAKEKEKNTKKGPQKT
jgi:hypothetical protein